MKTGMRVLCFILIGVFTVVFFTGCGSADSSGTSKFPDNQNADKPIVFTDAVFESLLKTELGKEKIIPSDLAGYTGLKIAADKFLFLTGNGKESRSIVLKEDDSFEYQGTSYKGFGTMKSLSDLKYFTDLHTLEVSLQPDIDYAAIPIFGQIKRLTITQSAVADISFLSKAPGLILLNLYENDVTDIAVLANCTSLQTLSMNWNRVSDLSPLAGLSSLSDISFYGNNISDLNPLANLKALEDIGFYKNQITDISALRGLTSLKTIDLSENRITDVSPLKDFTSLERLNLKGNPVKNIALLKNLSDALEF